MSMSCATTIRRTLHLPLRTTSSRHYRATAATTRDTAATPRKRFRWTLELDKKLIDLRANGTPWRHVPQAFDMTAGACGSLNVASSRFFYITGPSSRHPLAAQARNVTRIKHRFCLSIADMKLIEELREQGYSYQKISTHFEDQRFGSGAIRHLLQHYKRFGSGPRTRGRRFTKAEDELLIKLFTTGASESEICKHFPTRSFPSCRSRFTTYLRTSEAVGAQVVKPPSRWSTPKLIQLLDLRRESKTCAAMSQTLNMPEKSIRNKLSLLGMRPGGDSDRAAIERILHDLRTGRKVDGQGRRID